MVVNRGAGSGEVVGADVKCFCYPWPEFPLGYSSGRLMSTARTFYQRQ